MKEDFPLLYKSERKGWVIEEEMKLVCEVKLQGLGT